MADNYSNNQNCISFCIAVINQLRSRTISTHNYSVRSREDDYASGVAFAYYRAYVLLQHQAAIFLIPLQVVGLNAITEDDLLSQTIIEQVNNRRIKRIPEKHKEAVIGWMKDQVYVFKDELLISKELLREKIASTQEGLESSLKYYDGEIHGYTEILNYMCEQANAHGVPLASLHLDDLDLKTLKR